MKNKNDWKARKKKAVDAIINQNERLVALRKKDNHKDNYKEIYEELVKAGFDKTKELTDEINQNDLIYYFKANTFRKGFYNFNNGTELF